MKSHELIEKLSALPPNAELYVVGGYDGSARVYVVTDGDAADICIMDSDRDQP